MCLPFSQPFVFLCSFFPFINWEQLSNLQQSPIPLQFPLPDVVIATDASLCRMAFHLSGKVVALHLGNITAKAYLCNQGGTLSPFLSRLACLMSSLTNTHGITPIPAYIPTHLNVEANYLSQDWMLPEWHLLPQVAHASSLGPSRGGPAGIFSFHSMPALLQLGISTTSGGLGVECPQPSLDVSGKLHVSSSCICSSRSV